MDLPGCDPGGGLYPVVTGSAATREVIFTILLSVVLASSLNIILGYTGYVSFGHVVFFGLGGYVGLFLMSSWHASLWLAMLAGGSGAGVLAFPARQRHPAPAGRLLRPGDDRRQRSHAGFINNFQPFGGPVGISLDFQRLQAITAAPCKRCGWCTILVVALTLLPSCSASDQNQQVRPGAAGHPRRRGCGRSDGRDHAQRQNLGLRALGHHARHGRGVVLLQERQCRAGGRLPAALLDRVAGDGDAGRLWHGDRADYGGRRVPAPARLPAHQPDLQEYPAGSGRRAPAGDHPVHPGRGGRLAAQPLSRYCGRFLP